MTKEKALEHRKQLKKKKPNFRRQDSHKMMKLETSWRKPRGLQSKMRLGKKSYARCVETGWKAPVLVRGLTKDGLVPIVVCNLQDVATLEAGKHSAIVSGNVGLKKKTEIVKALQDKKISIFNIKDPAAFMTKVKEMIDARKKIQKDRAAKKAAAEKKKEQKKDDKKEKPTTVDEAKSEEEQKKKEQDRLLTKREVK